MVSKLPNLDRLSLEDLRQRRGEKWSTFAPDVLPAWVAEMDFPLAPPIQELLEESSASGDVGYPHDALDEGIPELFTERMRRLFAWEPDPAGVELLSDVVQGIYLALQTLSAPGSGVLIQTPIYPPFLLAASENDRPFIENRLVHTRDGYEIDFDALDRVAGPNTGSFLLCNPHNPSGKILTKAELEQLAERACRHGWVVLSDEIHADLLYEGRTHVPFASLGPEVAARTVTLTSATKAFNIPGLRLALAHFGSPELQSRFRKIPTHARGGLGLLGIHATLAAWRDGEAWLDHVRRYLEENRRLLGELLRQHLPGVVYRPPEATYLAWLDCSALNLGENPAAHFLERGRVALSPGQNFGDGYGDFVRLNFATSKALVQETVRRMARAIEGRKDH